MPRRELLLPLAAALAVTGWNALKPAVVDDAAYLRMAEQIAAHPFDPYGFEQFWYDRPEPAMQVLAPPVVPYLLALGLQFGDDLRLVKLTLLPAVWLLMAAGYDLFRRFAPGRERLGLLLLASSPAVLPMLNAMLDIPAVALSLGALAAFARGCDPGRRSRLGYALVTGLLAGLAFQAKYSAVTTPAVIVWYALLRGRLGLAAVATLVAALVAGGWEAFLVHQYGQSHFLYHAAEQSGGGSLAERIGEKLSFARPLVNYLGLLACGWGLVCGRATGLPRWAVTGAMAGFSLGLAAVILGPLDWVRPARPPAAYPRLGLALTLFGVSGLLTLLTVIAGLVRTMTRRPGRSRYAWFFAGWLAIEITTCLALTPFPAGRRVVAVSVVLGFMALRAVAVACRREPACEPGRGVVAYAVGLGVLVAALDHWDARPEMTLVGRAAAVARPGRVWTQGAWGWQYYARRAGFREAAPGLPLAPGDWLVLPVKPPADGFFRPGGAESAFDPRALELVETLAADDAVPYSTLPALYGGATPVAGRDFPRLTVAVYRVTRLMRPVGKWGVD